MLTLEAPARDRQAPGGESTLDDLIVGAWEGLTARRTVPCPVCASPMAPLRGSATHSVIGRCEDCGSRLV